MDKKMEDINKTLLKYQNNIFLTPILIGIFMLMLNMQWMALYQLPNAPVGDSLVYITEAYNDYWIVRSGNLGSLFNKYYLVGNQINSPLLSFLAVLSFLLFGLEPENAYLVMGLLYLLWIAGVVYLAQIISNDRKFTVASGILAACLPSACVFELRHFMLDFAAATPFMWATAYLIKSNLLHKRKEVFIYALLVCITILFRSTAFIYFISHIGIILFQSILTKRHPNYKNMLIVGATIIFINGTFIIPNLSRIIGYYGYWAQQANELPIKNSFGDNLIFYIRQLNSFHMLRPGFAVYCVVTIIGACTLIIKILSEKSKQYSTKNILAPLAISLILIILPTIVLSSYSSRASSVDFIFIGAYVFLPIIFWRSIFPKSNYFWIPILLILLAFSRTDFKLLIEGVQVNSREREVLSMILADADRRGLGEVVLGNTAIHQHNSLSYQYWTLANFFPRWTNKIKLVAIGRTNSPEELAKMNSGADYVIVLDGYNADWHPNNVVAPEANKILREKYHMKMLPYEFNLPDGVVVRVLTRQVSAVISPPHPDGWHENNLVVRLMNPLKKEILLKISGELINAKKDQTEAIVSLTSKSNPENQISFVVPVRSLNYVVKVPQTYFNSGNTVDFKLSSSLAGSPSSISVSKDQRNLAFRNLKVQIIN
jgi:hypothetical protein